MLGELFKPPATIHYSPFILYTVCKRQNHSHSCGKILRTGQMVQFSVADPDVYLRSVFSIPDPGSRGLKSAGSATLNLQKKISSINPKHCY
jgi:hypothetical protein